MDNGFKKLDEKTAVQYLFQRDRLDAILEAKKRALRDNWLEEEQLPPVDHWA